MNEQAQRVPRVLLVDDDADGLTELHEGLEMLGIPALTAMSAAEALDLVEKHGSLEVIVTDLQLPRIDGIELLQKLATRRRSLPLAAIVVTGHASLDRAVSALRLRVLDFLQKPVTADEVASAIARAFALVGGAPTQARTAGVEIINTALYLRVQVAAQVDRTAIFETDLFGDPAWEMLLDLFMSEAYHRPISVTSLCIASGAPTTTALRRIDDLVTAGLVEREPDQQDRRRTVVKLTTHGRERMEAFLRRQLERLGQKPD
jgi:CheY-like chemotaxis protein